MTSNFLEFLKTQRDFRYIEQCLSELPNINWLDFAEKMYRKHDKTATAIICAKSMHFFSKAYEAKTGKSLNHELVEIKRKQDFDRLYELIDDFVGYSKVEKKLSPGAISVYVRGIRRVLYYAGIKIDVKDFKERVYMAEAKPPRDEYPNDEQIKLILSACSPNVRAFVMLLCETGLGRGEAIRLRPKDFRFDEDPVRIETQRHKTGENIETFCTKETAATIKQLVISKNLKDTDLIFVKRIGMNGPNKIAELYAMALKRAGLDQRIEIRVGDQIQEHKYHKFHLHVYRKRWFTKAINVVPAYIAHAMLGRKQYLDQYLAHPIKDRQEFYKKIAKHVSVFENKADKAEVLAEASKIAGVELTPEKLEAIKALIGQFAKMPIEDINQLKNLLGGQER